MSESGCFCLFSCSFFSETIPVYEKERADAGDFKECLYYCAMTTKRFKVLGLMSGTSLDGLDIALCDFHFAEGRWHVETLAAETSTYTEAFRTQLLQAMTLPGEALTALDRSFGAFQGKAVAAFLQKHALQADLVSAHGHTVFHNPAQGYTLQIGNGAALHAACGIPVVCDLRSLDVALGGQGAPLVPLGDALLYPDYQGCLNLGGIANISLVHPTHTIAFDICAVNMALNLFAEKTGKAYDAGGQMARGGVFIPALAEALDALPFYTKPYPKSIGREWVEASVLPLIEPYLHTADIKDLMHTYTLHAAGQIARELNLNTAHLPAAAILVSGGGAFHEFLIEQIRLRSDKQLSIVVPDAHTIQFKEAIIFAFLGLLRMLNLTNTKSTVTGASEDCVSGAVYGNFNAFYEV